MIETQKIAVTTAGADGAAVGTAYSQRPINGQVHALFVDWGATAPATSDITVTVEADDDHPAITLYSKTDSATDANVYPKVQSTDINGAVIAAQYQHIVAAGRVKVVVGGCNALAPAVTVYVYVEKKP